MLKKIKSIMDGFGFNLRSVEKQYVGKNFKHKVDTSYDKAGSYNKCSGISKGEHGEYMLQMVNGEPIPLRNVDYYLEPINFDPGEVPVLDDFQFSDEETKREYEVAKMKKLGVVAPQEMSPNVLLGTPVAITKQPVVNAVSDVKPIYMFGNLTTSKTSFKMAVDVDMPDFMLVKMLYKNSADKDKFINDLSIYIKNAMTIDDIKSCVVAKLGDSQGKKSI